MATIDEQVGASTDDAKEFQTTSMNLTATEVQLVAANQKGGFRFTSVNIPSGATIDVAYMEWYLPNDDDDYFDGKTIYCENGSNPSTFTTDAGDISNRTTTTASTAAGSGGQGTGWKTTPSLVDEVQEVVTDQGGTGDALVFLIYSTTTNDLDIQSWDEGDHSLAAKLHIEYTEGAAGLSIPVAMATYNRRRRN